MYPQCEAPQSPSSWSTRFAASCWNWPNTSLEICSYIDKWYLNLNFCCANAWFKEEFSMIFANQSIDCWMVINISQDPPPTWPVGQKDYFQPRVFFVSNLIWSGVWMVCRNPTCKFSTLEKEKAHPWWRKMVERGHGGKNKNCGVGHSPAQSLSHSFSSLGDWISSLKASKQKFVNE